MYLRKKKKTGCVLKSVQCIFWTRNRPPEKSIGEILTIILRIHVCHVCSLHALKNLATEASLS